MSEEKIHTLQVVLYETGDKECRDIASLLSDPRREEPTTRRFIDKKVYRLLGNIIDEASANCLKEADKRINKLWNKLFRDGGWYTSRFGASQFDNEEESIQMFPKEFIPGVRLYHVERDENGYHLQDFEPEINTIYYFARQSEEKFLEDKKEELAILHQMYSLKERIMYGEYQLKDIRYAPVARAICEYLGFEKAPEKVPTK